MVRKGVLISRSVSFILGFSLIFVLLGASASYLGQVLSEYRDWLEKVGGIFVVLFGLQMAGMLQLDIFMKEVRWLPKSGQKGLVTSFVLGLAFGAGWTPCVGLALSSILFMAGTAETAADGMFYLLIYSMG
ncbi:cytochrome c biogenesis CcdA family protein [Brevibacillus sp. H7]|uniref:cytochrome c biogenesis CcdA family protein n=1 Tax=Brevibacillus sp. H7 TaxID=3349138 RepID=UPI0038122DCE